MFAEYVNALAKSSQSRESEPYRPRPSYAGPERCIRDLVYEANGTPGALRRGRSILAMKDGKVQEEITKAWFREFGFEVKEEQSPIFIPARGLNPKGYFCEQCEYPVPPHTLHGHIDWVAKFSRTRYEAKKKAFRRYPIPRPLLERLSKETNNRLFEHKALTTYAVTRYLSGSLPWDYIVQTVIYLRAAQEIKALKIKKASLLIKDKNSGKFLEYEILYNRKTDTATVTRRIESNGDLPAIETKLGIRAKGVIRKALKKFRDVDRLHKAGRIPPRPFLFGTEFPCGWCRHEKTCWTGYLGEIRQFSGGLALSAEIDTAARFYKQLGAQIGEAAADVKELKKAREDVKATIIEYLNRKKIVSGKTKNYLIEHRRKSKNGEVKERLFVDRIKTPRGLSRFKRKGKK